MLELIEKLLHPTKSNATAYPPIPLDVYLLPAQMARCHKVFFYPNLCIELFRQRQAYPESCHIQRKAMRQRIHAYRLMYIFCQHKWLAAARCFSTRICALNYFSSVKPIRKTAASTKSNATAYPRIPLDVYLLPAQMARCRRAFFYPNLCIELFRQRQAYPENCCIYEKQSGRASTHTA